MTTATTDPPETTTNGTHTHSAHMPELVYLPIDSIDRGLNHRIPRHGDEQRILDLMQSIEASGQLQPVRVYDVGHGDQTKPRYVLGFGWRRCEAMSRLGFEKVRAEVYPPAPDHEIEAARAIENLHRQDITPVEEAQAVADILAAYAAEHPADSRQAGLEHAAAKTARSVSWIRDRDYFSRLSAPVRELANRVAVPAGHLRELAKVGDEALQLRIAMETVGLSPWRFKAGTLEPNDADDARYAEEFFANAAAGVLRIENTSWVKRHVEDAQRSLRSVPWVMELPVLVSGRTALPACDACPHNTANDLTLFGVETGDDGEPPQHGTCMSPVCYQAKKDTAEKERGKALSALQRLKNGPTPAKLNAKVDGAPDWLDKKKLKGFLQRKTKVQADPPAGSPASASGTTRRLDPELAEACARFRGRIQTWARNAGNKIDDASKNDVARRAGLLLFMCTKSYERFYHDGEMKIPYDHQLREGTLIRPTSGCPIDADTHAMLDMIETGRAEEIVKIAGGEPCDYYEPGSILHPPDHPELLTRLMEAMKVPAKEITPAPRWEDFDPAAQPAQAKAPAKKAAPKKKATRKKTPGKKTAKKKPVPKRVKKQAAK